MTRVKRLDRWVSKPKNMLISALAAAAVGVVIGLSPLMANSYATGSDRIEVLSSSHDEGTSGTCTDCGIARLRCEGYATVRIHGHVYSNYETDWVEKWRLDGDSTWTIGQSSTKTSSAGDTDFPRIQLHCHVNDDGCKGVDFKFEYTLYGVPAMGPRVYISYTSVTANH